MKNILGLKNYTIALFFLALAFVACKKDKTPDTEPNPVESNTKQTPTTNRTELSNDSIFLYAKEIYYWNEDLPTYDEFEPRKYTTYGSNLNNYNANLYNLGKASGSADFVNGSAVLKYSYIDDIADNNPQAYVAPSKAAVDLEGNGNDAGIRPIAYLLSESLSGPYLLFVTAVYPGSPAEAAGVKRGWRINKINGRTVGANYNNEESFLNSTLEGSMSIEGVKYANGTPGAAFNINLEKKSYSSSPIYLSKTFTAGSKKIGYLALARFSNLESNAKTALDDSFSSFAREGVTDLIIDLRYNGGGYVNTAEYLVNLIAPSSLNGMVMFKEYYNSTMQSGKAKILSHQPLLDGNNKIQYENGKIVTYADIDFSPDKQISIFSKKGNLNGISNVVFIVSGNTASASELVINSLKPHLTVKLVGEKTYGKPIGFFSVRIENKYDVFMSLFETKNSKGEGGYFNGMIPDYAENDDEETFFDNPFYDFGDKNEEYLAKALSVIPGISAPVTGSRSAKMNVEGKSMTLSPNVVLKPVKKNDEFIGMIETRFNTK